MRFWQSLLCDVCAGSTVGRGQVEGRRPKCRQFIRGDKLKTQVYCEILDLDDQIEDERGSPKAKQLSQKVDKLAEKQGPEYIALVSGLKDIDPNSQKEVYSILDPLDDLCGDY